MSIKVRTQDELEQLASSGSFLGSLFLVFVVAYITDGFAMVKDEIPLLLSGGVLEIIKNHTPFSRMAPVVLAAVVIDLALSLIAGIVADVVAGPAKGGFDSGLDSWFRRGLREVLKAQVRSKKGKPYSLFHDLLSGVFLEETFARWFCIGVFQGAVTYWFGPAAGAVAFYIAFISGNGIWSLIHLRNYEDKSDRHPVRVLPQFVSGVFLTYVYVKFGFLAVLLAHFGRNAVLEAAERKQRVDITDSLMSLVWTLMCCASYLLLGASGAKLSDVLQWVQNDPVFVLPGWSFMQYFLLLVFSASLVHGAFSILLYDRPGLREAGPLRKVSDAVAEAGVWNIVFESAFYALFLGTLNAAFRLFGLFLPGITERILAIAVLACFRERAHSPSAASRVFWTNIPIVYVQICVFQAVGFWQALLMMVLFSVVMIPCDALKLMDD